MEGSNTRRSGLELFQGKEWNQPGQISFLLDENRNCDGGMKAIESHWDQVVLSVIVPV